MNAITFLPDEHSSDPLYLQVYKHLTSCIRNGELRDGEKLPSKRTLAAHLHVSLSTVETAYDMLVTEGYVTARARSGYYANGIGELVPDPLPVKPEKKKSLLAPPSDMTLVRMRWIPRLSPTQHGPRWHGKF